MPSVGEAWKRTALSPGKAAHGGAKVGKTDRQGPNVSPWFQLYLKPYLHLDFEEVSKIFSLT